MPSNVVLNPGAAGASAATAQISHDGDTAQLQLIGVMGIAGTEDAYTAAKINGDATNGLDVDVTRLPALPAGTNNIGDIDVLSVIPGTGATNLGKAEDVAHASGDVGVLAIAVRRDTAAVGVDVDGDYAALAVDANGRLHVNSGAPLPAGTNNIGDVDVLSLPALPAGTNNIGDVDILTLPVLPAGDNNIGNVDVVSLPAGSIAATTAKTSDYDTGAGTDTVPMVGIALPASGGAVQGGTATNPVRTDPTGTTTQPVSGTVTANLAAGVNNIGDVDILTIAAGDNNIGNVDIVTVPADPFGVNADAASATGSISAKLRFIAATGIPVTSIAAGDNNIGNVDIVTLPALPAGTNAIGTVTAVGAAAHDAAVSGNPLLVAGEGRTSDVTAVANGDLCRVQLTTVGKQVNYPYAVPGNTWNYAAASGGIVNTTGVSAKAAAGAGIRNYITRVQVINGHATVSTDVQIRDGAAGTVLWRGFAQAAGGGIACDFDPPLRGTANTLVEIACGTTGSATYFNLQGFTSAE